MKLTALTVPLPLPVEMVVLYFKDAFDLRTGWSNLQGDFGACGFFSLAPGWIILEPTEILLSVCGKIFPLAAVCFGACHELSVVTTV